MLRRKLSALEEAKAQIENINLAIDEWHRIVERCRAELNDARTSAAVRQKNSQHTKGQAADIASDNPHCLAGLVLQKNLPFDQMILYNNFVHSSHRYPGPQRGLVLYDEGYEGGEIITEK